MNLNYELDSLVESNSDMLRKRINKETPELLEKYPIERYVYLIENEPILQCYPFRNSELQSIPKILRGKYSDLIAELYLKLVLTELLKKAPQLSEMNRYYPDSVIALFLENYQRIIDTVARENDLLYSHQYDKFMKDALLCLNRFIPIGAQYVILMKMPLGWIFKYDLTSFILGMKHIIFSGIRKPVWGIHTFSHDYISLSKFTPAGILETLSNLAELTAKNPVVTGLLGSSWFFDPALKTYGTNLYFMTNTLIEHNAVLMFSHVCTGHCLQDALFLSPTRERFNKDGIYIPKVFRIYMNRKNILTMRNL